MANYVVLLFFVRVKPPIIPQVYDGLEHPPVLSENSEALQALAALQPKPLVPAQPALLIETTTQDTGERKQMFGYTARHVITTVKQIPLVESTQIPQETVTDGWYIDLDTSAPCVKVSASLFAIVTGGPRKPGEPPQTRSVTYKTVGKPETGLALMTKEILRATLPFPNGSTQTRKTLQTKCT